MLSISANTPTWWDRDVDDSGNAIRADVLAAGHAIWNIALKRARRKLGDPWQAAELMEKAVARISKYLNRRRPDAPPKDTKRLVLLDFTCRLRRAAGLSRKLEFLGGAEELDPLLAPQQPDRAAMLAELAKIEDRVSAEFRRIFQLYAQDYSWQDIADIMGKPRSSVCNAFWREVERIRAELALSPRAAKAS